MKRLYNKVMGDSLYKNSIFLMISTGVMSLLGFVFWMITTRLFPEEQVGLATTIVSIITLITTFSLLGLNAGLIRYLPKSNRKNDKINTCFTLTGIVTIIVSTIFILGISIFSPRLMFIKDNMILSFLFIIFMVIASFSTLLESVFIAYRKSKYVLMKNAIFSAVKIIPLFFAVGLGAYGIFGSWMIGMLFGAAASFLVLIFKFGYEFHFVFYDSILKKIGKYSFGNYVAGFIGGLPAMIIPIMITNSIHPETTAYYYMAMMIATALFIIPNATSNSLFAEGSHNEKNLKKQTKKAMKIIAILMIPAIIITIVLGKYVLLLFGSSYSSEGYMFLNLLAISGIFVSINAVYGSLFKIQHKIKEMIIRSVISAVSVIGLVYLFMDKGLFWIGVAWLIGQAIVTLSYIILRRK